MTSLRTHALPLDIIAQTPSSGGMGLPYLIAWLGGMFALMYFIYIRPQQKRQKQHQGLLAALKRGDRVLTSGGMYGTVIGLKDDIVVLKIAEDTKAEFRRSAVVEVEKSGE